MPDNLRSQVVTQGVQRSPNRAMLRAVGFGDRDFIKPIIGLANGYSTITPCNMGLNELAKRAETGVKVAGAMPQMFGTITISFAKSGSAPGGLILQGWTMLDAQNNRTTVRLSNQRFNVPISDSIFRAPAATRRGPRG